MKNFYSYNDELEGKMLVEQIKLEEPNVPIVSFSQLQSWDRCEMQWYLGYIEGWTEREPKSYLTLGSLGHEDIAGWYRTHSREYVQQLFGEHFNKYAMSGDLNLPMLAEESWLVLRYIDDFIPSEDQGITAIHGVEEHFIIALWTPKGRKFYLQGYLDLRTEDSNGTMWIWDHKFSGKFWSPNEVLMDPQLPTYAAAFGEVGIDIFGVIVNQFNTYEYKKKEDVPPNKLFKREYHYVNRFQQRAILTEVGQAVDDLIEKRASNAPARRRLRRDCSRCWFQNPCLMGLQGHDMQQVLMVDYKKKNSPEEAEEYEAFDIYL